MPSTVRVAVLGDIILAGGPDGGMQGRDPQNILDPMRELLKLRSRHVRRAVALLREAISA